MTGDRKQCGQSLGCFGVCRVGGARSTDPASPGSKRGGERGAGLRPRWPSDPGPAPFLRHVHFLLPSTFAPAPTPPAGPLPGTVPLQNPATPREGALSPRGCPGRGLSSTADLRGGRGLRVLWASGGGASGRAACPSRSPQRHGPLWPAGGTCGLGDTQELAPRFSRPNHLLVFSGPDAQETAEPHPPPPAADCDVAP